MNINEHTKEVVSKLSIADLKALWDYSLRTIPGFENEYRILGFVAINEIHSRVSLIFQQDPEIFKPML